MSTRYVWGKYTKTTELVAGQATGPSTVYTATIHKGVTVGWLAPSYKINSDGKCVPSGNYFRVTSETTNPSTSTFKYFFTATCIKYVALTNTIEYGPYSVYLPPTGAATWHIFENGTYQVGVGGDEGGFIRLYTASLSAAKGSFVGNVSSSSSSAYPNDGASGDNWYTYAGSDSIDPTAINYSTSKPGSGDTITVSITRPNNTLGGTVYYQYSYSVNGGASWTNAGSKTTATSQSITIPAAATQFQARIQASDDIGFTSSSYITGTNLIINQAPNAPRAVTIPDTVAPGEKFMVSWTASTDPNGNLSGYEVQRTLDGTGSYTTITELTADTSITDTITTGHTSVQYRVRAKDTEGLTSGWAYSDIASLHRVGAYVGVNGVARRVGKMYVGVGGKARKVKKGYVGVNGVARLFWVSANS